LALEQVQNKSRKSRSTLLILACFNSLILSEFLSIQWFLFGWNAL